MKPVLMRAVTAAAIAVLSAAPAAARDLYRSVVTIGTDTVVQTANSLTDLDELFDDSSLSDLFPSYIPGVSAVGGALDIRGLTALATYAASSTSLRFAVPVAGIDVTFTGADRDESQEMFEDWLRGKRVPGVDNAVTDLLQALVAESAVDPVAGNPNSLQSRMLYADLELGSRGPFLSDYPDASQRIPMLFRLDAGFGQYSAGPYGGQTYDLSLGIGWNILRRLALVSDLSGLLSVIEGDAIAGHGSLGIGLQGRILDWWNLGLVGRAGLVGSIDVGAVAAMYSVSLINHMRFDLDAYGFGDYRIEMRNMVGVANTANGLEIKGIELEYDLTNVVFKNGLELSRPIGLGSSSRALRARLFWTDTHFVKDELWLEHSDEIGLGIALANRSGVATYDPVNVDISYVFGDDYDALRLRASFRF